MQHVFIIRTFASVYPCMSSATSAQVTIGHILGGVAVHMLRAASPQICARAWLAGFDCLPGRAAHNIILITTYRHQSRYYIRADKTSAIFL